VFVSTFDLVHAIGVWLFTGPTNTDDDYRRYIEEIHRLDPKGAGRDAPAAILIVDKGNPIPDARWRREIAEASATLKTENGLFVVVSDSRLVRGAVTAINWIRPPPYEWSVHDDLNEAIRWVESKRGRPLPVIAELVAQARAEAAARSS